MIPESHADLLRAIALHGPLTFSEAAAAAGQVWSDAHCFLLQLQRSGHVVILDDARVRLTAVGRQLAQEASRS